MDLLVVNLRSGYGGFMGRFVKLLSFTMSVFSQLVLLDPYIKLLSRFGQTWLNPAAICFNYVFVYLWIAKVAHVWSTTWPHDCGMHTRCCWWAFTYRLNQSPLVSPSTRLGFWLCLSTEAGGRGIFGHLCRYLHISSIYMPLLECNYFDNSSCLNNNCCNPTVSIHVIYPVLGLDFFY